MGYVKTYAQMNAHMQIPVYKHNSEYTISKYTLLYTLECLRDVNFAIFVGNLSPTKLNSHNF